MNVFESMDIWLYGEILVQRMFIADVFLLGLLVGCVGFWILNEFCKL